MSVVLFGVFVLILSGCGANPQARAERDALEECAAMGPECAGESW